MPFFTEQMESLTNELRTSTRERAAFVNQVQDVTHKHLAEVQPFLHALTLEHKAMTEHLRDMLATNRQENRAAVNTLRQKFQEEFQSMRAEMQELLKLTREQRQHQLAETRIEFHTAREAVASDLRQAAQVWRQRTQTRSTLPELSHSRGKGRAVVAGSVHVEHGRGVLPEPKTEHVRSTTPMPKSEHSHATITEPKASHGHAAIPEPKADHGHGHSTTPEPKNAQGGTTTHSSPAHESKEGKSHKNHR